LLAASVAFGTAARAEPETDPTGTEATDDGSGTTDPDLEEPEEDAPSASTPPAKAPPKRGIEEIVVQAGESDSAEDFQAGDSVAAFDASDLEALGAQSIEDLAAFTPNLEIVTAGATTPTFFIRGVGLNDFAANSAGAVAVYQNDVPLNSPALQLGTLFDVEGVNVLRGPQGTGPFRNASAGAIKVYSRKPTGEFGGYFTSSYGNFNAMDFEGAVEAPVYEDILSARFAFRYTDRDGYADNGCGNAVPDEERGATTALGGGTTNSVTNDGLPLSLCGERVYRTFNPNAPNPSGKSLVPEGLPEELNNTHNWAARGTILFQPTLDMEWMLTAQGGRRNELSRIGQAYGTRGTYYDPECLSTLSEDVLNNPATGPLQPCLLLGILGGFDAGLYQTREVKERIVELEPCSFLDQFGQVQRIQGEGECSLAERRVSLAQAQQQVAQELAKELDSEPHRADVNRVGPTQNDVWGVSLKGDIVLGEAVNMTTVTGYNTYDRFVGIDLDFSPNQLFEFETKDSGYQITQDLSFSGYISEDYPLKWEIGGFFLQEQLDVFVENFFDPNTAAFQVAARDYTQDLLSLAGYLSLSWDFWEDFTLDGGFRYNWEQKKIDYILFAPERIGGTLPPTPDYQERIWQAPTGTARLTYRFREDTHAFFKYTRGWKGGHFNATASDRLLVTAAEPETIDAFEAGVRGSWFGGRLNAQFSTFYYDYSNYQIFTARQVLGAPPEFVVLNASSAEVYGAELDLVARPLPGLYLQARLSWLESEFLDFIQTNQETFNGNVIVKEIQNTGNPLLNSPNYKVSLTAEQEIPLGRYGSLIARWDGAWTDDTYYDASGGLGTPNSFNEQFLPENTIGQEAYWLHNVRLAYRTPNGALEIAGWCRNVEDKVYKTFAFDGSAFQSTTIYFVGEPRTYGLTVTANY